MAARLFCSRNYLAQIETGAKQPSDKLINFAEALAAQMLPQKTNPPGVLAEDPAPYGVPPPRSDGRIVSPPKLRLIPVVSWAHAGEAGDYDEIPEHEQDQIFYEGSDARAKCVIVEGDSMSPEWRPGDRVIIEPAKPVLNGSAVVVKLANNGVLIRYFHRVDAKTIRLYSHNPDRYPDTFLKQGQYQWCFRVGYTIRKNH